MVSDASASPCFTPGTLIVTARGLRPVDSLVVGDKVVTADNGLQPVLWVGRRRLGHAEIERRDELRPILVRRDALGPDCPNRDMLVSPKHRFLVPWLSASGVEEERLIAAERLTDHNRIGPAHVLGVTYLHLLFERHQVILADHVWTESFLPDKSTWERMGNAQRLEIEALYPEVLVGGLARLADPARPIDDRPLWQQRMG